MQLLESPASFVDQDDNRLAEMKLERSRFDVVAVKELDRAIEVRAHDPVSDSTQELRLPLTDERFKGVTLDSPMLPRDIDDDIRDALNVVGHAVVTDPSTR